MDITVLRRVNDKKGALVRKAEKVIDDTKIFNEKDFGEAQLKNICNVASTSPAVEVVKNFIKYQIGRSSKDKGWKYKEDEKGDPFGQRVLKDLDEIEKTHLPDICKEVTDERAEVMMQLTRLYFGYMTRYFKFFK